MGLKMIVMLLLVALVVTVVVAQVGQTCTFKETVVLCKDVLGGCAGCAGCARCCSMAHYGVQKGPCSQYVVQK